MPAPFSDTHVYVWPHKTHEGGHTQMHTDMCAQTHAAFDGFQRWLDMHTHIVYAPIRKKKNTPYQNKNSLSQTHISR